MATAWLREVFATDHPIIAMAHFPPLPGAPLYAGQSIGGIVDQVGTDVAALQDGGVDGVMFCNENDRPYVLKARPETIAVMSAVVAALGRDLRVPHGIDILWDPIAALAVAKATGGRWVREVFTGAYAGEVGLWDTACGEALRYRRAIDAQHVRVLYNVNAEFAAPLAPRPLDAVARSIAFTALADALCVSGPLTGSAVALDDLSAVRAGAPDMPLFANTGVTAENVRDRLAIADGAIVGTSLKVDGVTWNPVDRQRTERLMAAVRAVRGG
jgi:membrane complex biogenesis BtpA family protein